ncbi:Protein bax [Vibrio scophthalmi]|uniref:Putative Bax protein n=1 Tax=Vibrio scophthalmi LMG 19158 TaxID=870967 RepID=F9RSG0_9VIBR|nr:glucosaminidase domain-containing protein [Vibrio scophthalmi]ANS85461.1 Protein bax [Vibrio scophthalmi]EGU32281.1 putative Bax protein [Vibrio scophthalmi LMG 19158]
MHKLEIAVISAAFGLGVFGWFRFEYPTVDVEQGTTNQILFVGQAVGSAPNFASFDNVVEKKQAFFDYLRPGVELENQRVQKERARLTRIAQRFAQGSLTSEDNNYAKRLGKLYDVEVTTEGITVAWLDKMLHRVNVLPESLVMTQAANESAWGTSRFATNANNYFGQWCYSKGCGLIPLQRNDDASHEVASFDSVQESIHRYFMNVNRNRAYYDLREIRFDRQQGEQSLIDTQAAIALTNGLLKYSERGEAYVKDLQTMIRHNDEFWTDYNDLTQ